MVNFVLHESHLNLKNMKVNEVNAFPPLQELRSQIPHNIVILCTVGQVH